MRALIPASLLAVFAFSCGTLVSGTGAWQAIMAHALLLLCALLGLYAWKDPWRLGSRWAWFVWLPLALALLSDCLSPVARAGWMGLCLAPAFVLLPAAVDRCLRGDEREIAAPGLALVLLAVSTWALIAWWYQGSARPASPLGHHNLLAVFLVPLLPLAAAAAMVRGWRRWLGIVTLVIGVGVVLATRSLDGSAALAVEIAAVAFMWRRMRFWALMAALVVVLALSPRAFRVLSGADSSLHVRMTYAAAGLGGISRRPVLGWGPGAVPWTIGANLKPKLRVNPANEVVGDLHCLPLQWTYELGIAGLITMAVLLWLFVRARLGEPASEEATFDRRLALVGTLGLVVEALSNSQIEILALPIMAAVLLGVWMSGGSDSAWRVSRWREGWPAALVLLGCFLLLLRFDIAHLSYDQARRGGEAGRLGRLERAVRLDPRFPLYRFRLAVSLAKSDPLAAARQAKRAAKGSPGVAPLWLEAGLLEREAGLGGANVALVEACRLDRLAPMPAFFAALTAPNPRQASVLLAHALLLEPRLAAAPVLENRPALLGRTMAEIENMATVPVTWKSEFSRAATAAFRRRGDSTRVDLVLDADRSPYLSFSVYAFRRAPWPLRLVAVPLRRAGVDAMSSVPPLKALRGLPGTIHQSLSCGSD